MKWHNINKKRRLTEWYVVPACKDSNRGVAGQWCRNHSSVGKFYNHYTNTRWWFEQESDALLFALRWSNK